jgi:hypothetical protein
MYRIWADRLLWFTAVALVALSAALAWVQRGG